MEKDRGLIEELRKITADAESERERIEKEKEAEQERLHRVELEVKARNTCRELAEAAKEEAGKGGHSVSREFTDSPDGITVAQLVADWCRNEGFIVESLLETGGFHYSSVYRLTIVW